MTTIAITTVCLNANRTIARCLDSVNSQTVPPDEYIVIDGESSDGTLKLVERAKNSGTVTKLQSEADLGISEAFNKAWRLSNSEYVATLNADDQLSPNYLEVVRKVITESDPDIITSTINFVSGRKTTTIEPHFPQCLPPRSWRHPAINHPGMIIRKSLLAHALGYDTDYQIAMDVELFYRLLKFAPKIVTISDILVSQYDDGKSQREWLAGLHEMRRIEINNGRNPFIASLSFQLRRVKKNH